MTKSIHRILVAGLAVAALSGGAALAASSTFQNSCSNISFMYEGTEAALGATCLRADGTPNASVLLIKGISNENGVLTDSGGASSFQKSCGNIDIQVTQEGRVNLTALCRTSAGASQPASIELQGINNNNGALSY